MSEENFAKTPFSISELRAEKEGNCAKWTPRDALINVLRAIDAGEIDPDVLVVTYHELDKESKTDGFRVLSVISSPGKVETIGVLSYALHDLHNC